MRLRTNGYIPGLCVVEEIFQDAVRDEERWRIVLQMVEQTFEGVATPNYDVIDPSVVYDAGYL